MFRTYVIKLKYPSYALHTVQNIVGSTNEELDTLSNLN